ncbi:MAG TPA: M64 family metallopeptidase [Povalibacter sp.]|nr:M64 family metallopeptidase [Povalibacter sp.]
MRALPITMFQIALLLAGHALAEPPATLRVDYIHAGNALQENYALDRIVIEPLPWAGNPARPIDTTNRGVNLFEVVDPASGAVLYSRGFSTIFGEWRQTEEAHRLSRAFQESLRLPMPDKPVRVRVLSRDERNAFSVVWSIDVDPQAPSIERIAAPPPAQPIAIRNNGPSAHKVDLLVLGDGYTASEADKFVTDARRLTDRLFATSPFRERASDFNVWALTVPSPQSGISRPSTGTYRWSALGTRYDIFGSERYALTLDNRALREIAQYAPYEFIEILFNNDTYGGGGIFGQFSTAAAGNEWAEYLFIHEFGHHFAALADEYYTSPVAYQSGQERPEPWEPNVTALHDPRTLKWRTRVKPDTPLPTPWPKEQFDRFQRDYQKERSELRAANRPESEMNALFRRERAFTEKLLGMAANHDRVGAFEGANYQSSGYYRPQMQCIMFDRSERFCQVCSDAIEEIIDLYSR